MNETKLDMHMYKYGCRCVMKQSGDFPELDSSCRKGIFHSKGTKSSFGV